MWWWRQCRARACLQCDIAIGHVNTDRNTDCNDSKSLCRWPARLDHYDGNGEARVDSMTAMETDSTPTAGKKSLPPVQYCDRVRFLNDDPVPRAAMDLLSEMLRRDPDARPQPSTVIERLHAIRRDSGLFPTTL